MKCPTCGEELQLKLSQTETSTDVIATCSKGHDWKMRLRIENMLSGNRKLSEVEIDNTPVQTVALEQTTLAKITRDAWEKKYTAVDTALRILKESKDEEMRRWAEHTIKRSMREHITIIVQAVQQGLLSREEAIELHKEGYPDIEELI